MLGDVFVGFGFFFFNLGWWWVCVCGFWVMVLREFKVCLFGDIGVGKLSIVWWFVEDSFDLNINLIIGVFFMIKIV